MTVIPATIIPSHDVARLILGSIRRFLESFGLDRSPILEQIVYVGVIAVVAIVLGYVVRLVVLAIGRKAVSLRRNEAAQEILRQRVITKCSHIIPPLVFLALIPFAFHQDSQTFIVIRRIIFMYLIIMFGIGICSIVSFFFVNYDRCANKDNHPLKGIVSVVKGIVWIIVVILCAAVLVHRSPMALLGGLGAFAAVLMLVFKDPILGFVASIQLSANDMIRVGDWIVVPSTIANGVVVDVSLTVVKVQNWDNTIVMLPAYSLVSNPFQNWRGMSDSGVRQIDRQITIDNITVRAADDALIASIITKYPEMKDYVDARRKEAADGKPLVFNGGVAPVNGTIDSNLGLFRAYMCKYLLAHPAIAHDQNIIVRLMQGDDNGTPLDIYCFTSTTDWLAYEAIRTQVVEHAMTSAVDFGLKVYTTYRGEITLDRSEEPIIEKA